MGCAARQSTADGFVQEFEGACLKKFGLRGRTYEVVSQGCALDEMSGCVRVFARLREVGPSGDEEEVMLQTVLVNTESPDLEAEIGELFTKDELSDKELHERIARMEAARET